MSPQPIQRVLYLQKAEVLDQQQALVTRALEAALPDAEIFLLAV